MNWVHHADLGQIITPVSSATTGEDAYAGIFNDERWDLRPKDKTMFGDPIAVWTGPRAFLHRPTPPYLARTIEGVFTDNLTRYFGSGVSREGICAATIVLLI